MGKQFGSVSAETLWSQISSYQQSFWGICSHAHNNGSEVLSAAELAQADPPLLS